MSNVLAHAKKLLRIAQRGEKIKLSAHQRQRAHEFMAKRDKIVEDLKQCDLEMTHYMSAIIHAKGFEDNYRYDRSNGCLVRIEE